MRTASSYSSNMLVNKMIYGGANWYPTDQRIEFEALINIRPRLGDRSVVIQSQQIRQQVERVTRMILGGFK